MYNLHISFRTNRLECLHQCLSCSSSCDYLLGSQYDFEEESRLMHSDEWESSKDILKPMELQRTSRLESGSATSCGVFKTSKLPATSDFDVICTFG